MSTLKVEQIQHPDSSTPAISLDSSGGMSGSFPYPNRNLIYNGAMQVHQRGTSATPVSNGYKTVDRWEQAATATTSTFNQSVENDAPTGSGFAKSLKMLVTTANANPAAGVLRTVRQKLEGQDLQRIAKGTSSAQPLTLSFWVKSNVTGTYVCELYDNDNARQISKNYTINNSGTWEKVVITFPEDTTGILDNDNNNSLWCFFGLEAGINYTSGSLATSWQASVSSNRYVGQTNLAAAVNNYWQITGVQLEVGPVATGFEFKSFGQELRECQRYYYLHSSTPNNTVGVGSTGSTSTASVFCNFPVTMRITPILNVVNPTNFRLWLPSINDINVTSLVLGGEGGPNGGTISCSFTSNSSYGGNKSVILYQQASPASLAWSAEL